MHHVSFVPGEVNLLLTAAGEHGLYLWDVRKHNSYVSRIVQEEKEEENKENCFPGGLTSFCHCMT
jgi:hypothetical protein